MRLIAPLKSRYSYSVSRRSPDEWVTKMASPQQHRSGSHIREPDVQPAYAWPKCIRPHNAAGEYALTAGTFGEFVIAPAGVDTEKGTALTLDAGKNPAGIDFRSQ
jgi:hypothetical protein